MKVGYVVSDLSYPPLEGLHQQTLLLLAGLKNRGLDVELHGFVKSLKCLDENAMRRDLGISFASPPIEQPGLLLWSALRSILPLSTIKRRLLLQLNQESLDVLHFEGIAACSLASAQMANRSVLSFVDPGSRRNFRFSKLAKLTRKKLIHLAAGLIFLILERRLRRGMPTWHVVSSEDARYLERVHNYSRVVSVPVSLPPELNRLRRDGKSASVEQEHSRINVLVYADLRQPHMRSALKEFADHVFQKQENSSHLEFTILGRVAVDPELAAWFDGLRYEFVEWAEDYLTIICSADIVVLPDSVGTGLKNRAIQSMAAGVAVLGTRVAFEGLAVENGRDAFVVGNAEESRLPFGRLVIDANLRSSLGEAGRLHALEVFGSAGIAQRWEEIYRNILGDSRSK